MLSFAYIQPQLHSYFSSAWWWCYEWVQSFLYSLSKMLSNESAPGASTCSVWCSVRKVGLGPDLQSVYLWFKAADPSQVLPTCSSEQHQRTDRIALLPALLILSSLSGSPSSFLPLVNCVWPNEIIHLSSSPDVSFFTLSGCLLLFGSGSHDAHLWSFAVVLEVHDTLAFSQGVWLFSLFYFMLLNWKFSV